LLLPSFVVTTVATGLATLVGAVAIAVALAVGIAVGVGAFGVGVAVAVAVAVAVGVALGVCAAAWFVKSESAVAVRRATNAALLEACHREGTNCIARSVHCHSRQCHRKWQRQRPRTDLRRTVP